MTSGPAGGFGSTGARNVDPRSVDLTKVQRDWEQALDALLANWLSITADQRDQIVDQVRSAITSDDLAALARLNVSTSAAEAALVQAMTDMALQAARRVVDEAARQNVRIDPVATDTQTFAAISATLAALLAEGLTNSAGREALRRWSPSATGDDVSRAVREHLDSLSTSFLESYLGGALTAAQNAGRIETMLASPDVALYASEVMDARTCVYCREVDGRWIGNSQDPDIQAKLSAVYPNGGYVECLGGVRCRGTVVAVWRPQQVQTVEAHLPGQHDQSSHGKGGGVRDSLVGAKDVKAISAAAAAEARRITGRDIPFDYDGVDPQLAREYSEGVLRALERFPTAPLGGVRTFSDAHPLTRQHPEALAVTQGVGFVEGGKFTMQSTIFFNVGGAYADPAVTRERKRESHEQGHLVDGTPMGTALHEFGHVLTQGGGAVGHRAVYDRAVEHADAAGVVPRAHITRQVSAYASTAMGEFAAEAFADVMVNGSGASDLSQVAFGAIEEAYR